MTLVVSTGKATIRIVKDRIVWLRTNFGTIYGIDADTNGVV